MREKKDNKNSTGNGRMLWKPGNMVYPVPAVMVTAADREGKSNIITIAWTGTVCTNPPMAYISVRPERYSYGMLKETGEFVINLTTEKLVRYIRRLFGHRSFFHSHICHFTVLLI